MCFRFQNLEARPRQPSKTTSSFESMPRTRFYLHGPASVLLAGGLCLLTMPAAATDGVPDGAGPIAAPADQGPSLLRALTRDGTPMLDIRYRFENVDQAGFANAASANTVRTRFGYRTGAYQDFRAVVQAQNITPIGPEHYNNGSNAETSFPTIGDPRQTLQLYQANFEWTGVPETFLVFGREPLAFDNERWIGTADWRQHGQTMDALSVSNKSITDLDLAYSYVFHVNRSAGPTARSGLGGLAPGEYDMHSHLFHAAFTGFQDARISAYSYLLDMSNSAGNSTATTGARAELKHDFQDLPSGLFNAEFAHQSNAFNNPASYGFNYYLVEPGLKIGLVTGKFAYEVMEGSSTGALQAPLDTGHSFNGWAERFLTTPVGGLNSEHLALEYKTPDQSGWLGSTAVRGIWYDFRGNSNGLHYGNEYDARIDQTFYEHYTLSLQYAAYEADQFSADTQKIVVQLRVKY
jgi:hypothetical protein